MPKIAHTSANATMHAHIAAIRAGATSTLDMPSRFVRAMGTPDALERAEQAMRHEAETRGVAYSVHVFKDHGVRYIVDIYFGHRY